MKKVLFGICAMFFVVTTAFFYSAKAFGDSAEPGYFADDSEMVEPDMDDDTVEIEEEDEYVPDDDIAEPDKGESEDSQLEEDEVQEEE